MKKEKDPCKDCTEYGSHFCPECLEEQTVDTNALIKNGELISLWMPNSLGLVYKSKTDLTDCVRYAVSADTGLEHWKHTSIKGVDNSKK